MADSPMTAPATAWQQVLLTIPEDFSLEELSSWRYLLTTPWGVKIGFSKNDLVLKSMCCSAGLTSTGSSRQCGRCLAVYGELGKLSASTRWAQAVPWLRTIAEVSNRHSWLVVGELACLEELYSAVNAYEVAKQAH